MRLFLLVFICTICSIHTKAQKRVLIFHETQNYRHESIEKGIQAIRQIGNENNFETIASRDSNFFIENDLKDLELIIFLSTEGDILNTEEQLAFQNYMDNGGNFFGIHAAADTEHHWQWYGDLIGAYFDGHPEIQEAVLNIRMPQHMTVEHLPEPWERVDEWYNYKEIRNGLNVLITVDERSYEGGENGDFHPIAWFQNYRGGGKSVYTGLGHTTESYSDPNYLKHLSQCIEFATMD